MDAFLTVVSALLVVSLVFHVWATALLVREGRRSRWRFPALNERLFTSIVQTFSAFGLAIIGANRILGWNFATETVLLVLSVSLLIKVLPSIIWTYLYYTDGFNEDGSIRDFENGTGFNSRGT